MYDGMTEECRKAVEKFLKTAPAKWGYDGGDRVGVDHICAGAVFDNKTGKITRNQAEGWVCHSWCSHATAGKIVVNTIAGIKTDLERDFLEFCCKETPFSHGVLNRDDMDSIINGGMIIDAGKIGNNGVLWLCKAVRYIYEDKFRLKLWKQFIDAGADRFLAFVLASVHNREMGMQEYAGHNSVFSYMSPEDLKKVMSYVGKDHESSGDNTAAAFYPCKRYSYYNDTSNKVKKWMQFGGVKEEKIDDGWGGYIVKRVPNDLKSGVDAVKKAIA